MVRSSCGAHSQTMKTWVSGIPFVARGPAPDQHRKPSLFSHLARLACGAATAALVTLALLPFSPEVFAGTLIEIPFDPYWKSSMSRSELISAKLNTLEKDNSRSPCRLVEPGVFMYFWDSDEKKYSNKGVRRPTAYNDLVIKVLYPNGRDIGRSVKYQVLLTDREEKFECTVWVARTKWENKIRIDEFAAQVVNALAFLGAYYPHSRSDEAVPDESIGKKLDFVEGKTKEEMVAYLADRHQYFESVAQCSFSAAGTPLYPSNYPNKADKNSVSATPYVQLVLNAGKFPNTKQYLVRVFNQQKSEYCTAYWGDKYDADKAARYLISLGVARQ